jgi:hypothetical protein
MARVQQKNIYSRYPVERAPVLYALIFQTDSCLAFKSESPATYYNYALFADGPRMLTLDSLFTGEKWRAVITSETMNFLNAHPGIHADCSNSVLYSRIFNKSFSIGENGLIIHPAWSAEFIIPWTTLQSYLRPEIAHKLSLN